MVLFLYKRPLNLLFKERLIFENAIKYQTEINEGKMKELGLELA